VQVQQPTTHEDQVEITDPVALEKESLQYLQTLDPFLHTVSTFQIYLCRNLITDTVTYFQQSKAFFFLKSSSRCGNAPLPSLGLRKKVFGGFHLVTTVVDHVHNNQAHTNVQNVVVQEQVLG
jgi:hypothetical protein